MEYTCPHCGKIIHSIDKECWIDVTGIIVEKIESWSSIGNELRLHERLISSRGFYKEPSKRIIPRRGITISYSKGDIIEQLKALERIRSYKKIEELIKKIEERGGDYSFTLQPQTMVHEGEKCTDTYVLLDGYRGEKEKRAVRCCPFCQAPLSHLAGHFNSRTIILIRNSLWDKPSLLTTLKDACGDYTAGHECLIDENDEMFSLGEFLLKKNNKHLLLSVIEIDERVFAASNDALPEIDKERLESLLKNADYIWIPINKEYGGIELLGEAIEGRRSWLDKKKCLVRCMTNDEIRMHNVSNPVLKLYIESRKAKKWISDHDKTGRVLKEIEDVFKEKFYYFGSEKDDYKKALEWILFLEGIETDEHVYIGKTKGLLKTIFGRNSVTEENLYYNLTRQTGFMI